MLMLAPHAHAHARNFVLRLFFDYRKIFSILPIDTAIDSRYVCQSRRPKATEGKTKQFAKAVYGLKKL
jgi:hypothetical protein